jgi:hypothetical protein
MEMPVHPPLLQVPAPTKTGLSFCAATPADLKRWIAGLPRANVGETSRLLYQALAELNQLLTPPENRLQLFELLRPMVSFVCQQMERHFLNQSIVLEEHPRKVANLCQALQNHLNTGYKLALSQTLAHPSSDSLLATVLLRSIQGAVALLTRTLQLYRPVPEGLWLELHQLYHIACQHGLHRLAIRDPQATHAHTLSVEQSYMVALLLGCARCNQMRQESIARLAHALESWSALASLCPISAGDSLFAVAPQLDGPPRYCALFDPSELQGAFGIDPRPLVDAIKSHLSPVDQSHPASSLQMPSGFSVDLLQHLTASWGDLSERSFQRTTGTGDIHICIGMSALNYFLANERPFSTLLQLPKELAARFDAIAPPPDVWEQAFDAQPAGAWVAAPAHEGIEYSAQVAGEPTQTSSSESYPTHLLSIVNHSPGGYCLSWPKSVPSQLQTGELLGVQDLPTHGWSVAMVRWIHQLRSGNTQMGIELITPKAQSCGLQLVAKSDQKSQYLRALLLPEITAISKPPTIITPRIPFQEGNKVMININGKVRRALLGQKLIGTSSFSQFEYRELEPLNKQPSSAASAPSGSRNPSKEEDFDSLWKSL